MPGEAEILALFSASYMRIEVMDNCPTMTLDFVTSACVFNIVEMRIFIVCPENIVAIGRV